MPLPDSKRAKQTLSEIVTNEAPKPKRAHRTPFDKTESTSTIKHAF